jgi:hypothetical protein
MTKFTCVSIGFDKSRTTEREAATAEKAADACAAALHSAYWTEFYRNGEDRHGTYQEFTVKQSATRVHSTVRVYERYKH